VTLAYYGMQRMPIDGDARRLRQLGAADAKRQATRHAASHESAHIEAAVERHE
jgi:hypothetical protein